MYERFYGLQENPFTLTPDPAFLYMGRQHQHALTLLEYALQQGSGFALVSGEIGSGKTTVVNYLLSRVQRGLRIGVMNNTHPGIGSLLPWVMQCFGGQCLPSSASEQYEEFAQFLEREHHGGRRAVLIIDEAQNLTTDGLDELRVLSNLNSGKALLLQTILVGQPELRTTLRSRRMKQFAQRIAMDYHITPLCLADTHEYIRHRLKVAGGNPDLFSPAARALVHKSSDGVPRLINQVCDTALVYGFGEQSQLIGKEIIGQVLVDRRVGGLLPLMHPLRAIAREAAVD